MGLGNADYHGIRHAGIGASRKRLNFESSRQYGGFGIETQYLVSECRGEAGQPVAQGRCFRRGRLLLQQRDALLDLVDRDDAEKQSAIAVCALQSDQKPGWASVRESDSIEMTSMSNSNPLAASPSPCGRDDRQVGQVHGNLDSGAVIGDGVGRVGAGHRAAVVMPLIGERATAAMSRRVKPWQRAGRWPKWGAASQGGARRG